MKDFKATIMAFALTILLFLTIALVMPETRELIYGSLSFLGAIIKTFFLEELIGKFIILIFISAIGYIMSIKKRNQQKLWLTLTALADIISAALLFSK